MNSTFGDNWKDDFQISGEKDRQKKTQRRFVSLRFMLDVLLQGKGQGNITVVEKTGDFLIR